jgi:hypothetical protein
MFDKNVTTQPIVNFYIIKNKRPGFCFKFGLGKKIVRLRFMTERSALT